MRKGNVGCVLLFMLIFIFGMISVTIALHKEQDAKRYTIEGVVSSVESYTVDETVNKTTVKQEKTKITFQDGRSKEFFGIPSKPIETNKYYIITYNGFNTITNIDFPQ